MVLNWEGVLVDRGRLRTPAEINEDIRIAIAARGATGRLATWPVQTTLLLTVAGVDYAIKWLNGEVPQERGTLDYDAFAAVCEAYIYEVSGERLGVELNPLSVNGRVIGNYILVLPESLVY